jgi:hypothetical protein
MSWRSNLGIGAIAAVAFVAVSSGAASAADPPPPGTIGSFPGWHATKGAGTYTGDAKFDAVANFPDVSFTSDAGTVKTPTGDSAFLGPATGFGMHFGTTRAQPYLYLSAAAGGHPSTTTVTFAADPPPGWGFAVGDIDADYVQIIPRDANGNILDASVLNAQDTGGTPLLNYCASSPKPSSCSGPGPFADFPTWHPTGAVVNGTPVSGPLVLGSGSDTLGAYDWFLPDSTVRSLTFTYTVQTGIPIYQLWLAALAPVGTITGTITTSHGAPVPADTKIDLEHTDGTAVKGLTGDPVVEPIPPSGDISLDTADGTYKVAFDVPKGFDPIVTQTVTVARGGAALAPVTLDLAAPAGPQLAVTGTDVSGPFGIGILAVALGAVILVARRRKSRRLSLNA